LGEAGTGKSYSADKLYQEDLRQQDLQPNTDGVLECRGRIGGTTQYPFQRYTDTFLTQVHLIALHGGRWKKLLQWVLAVLSSSNKPKLRKMSFQVIVVDFAGLQECGLMYAV